MAVLWDVGVFAVAADETQQLKDLFLCLGPFHVLYFHSA